MGQDRRICSLILGVKGSKGEINSYLEKLHPNYGEDKVEQQCDKQNVADIL